MKCPNRCVTESNKCCIKVKVNYVLIGLLTKLILTEEWSLAEEHSSVDFDGNTDEFGGHK